MSISFFPSYTITPSIAQDLMRIEAAKQRVAILPINPAVLASLRETAKLYTTHYSTMIEGNRLKPEQIKQVLTAKGHFPGKERDEKEVRGYYEALAYVERLAAHDESITQHVIQMIHALVMGGGRTNVVPTPYREGQNVIKDAATGSIVYLPPEAHDVPVLMHALVDWINASHALPLPLVAAIVHYQFATIHPYYDGNGRMARLLTTLILHKGGYDLKGLYSLEEYYAKDLAGYYEAISVGPSHNYYMGRAESDITVWVAYFMHGAADAFEKVVKHMADAQNAGTPDYETLMRKLDPKQRKMLILLRKHEVITNNQVAELFGFKRGASAKLCRLWVAAGFLEIVDPSNRARTYQLAQPYRLLLSREK